jgi:2-dehydro-3-deoxyphosphooctonate aldolase (KDO 8-P synthase)
MSTYLVSFCASAGPKGRTARAGAETCGKAATPTQRSLFFWDERMREVSLTDTITVGPSHPLLVIAGPCVMEGEDLCIEVACVLRDACRSLKLPYVFKASFDKANRTSVHSFRGPGLEEGLRILRRVRKQVGVPVLTDVHRPGQADKVASVVDVIQIPAFLSRQTDLLSAAADTGLPVHVKKGQFLAPEDMEHVAEKIASRGNERVLLCERGASFGYHNLVVDFRSLPIMQKLGYPVIFDATHSTQRPGGQGASSGGDRELAPVLARAAVAAGADGVFIETHPRPEKARSDSATMLKLDSVPKILNSLKKTAAAAAGRPS